MLELKFDTMSTIGKSLYHWLTVIDLPMTLDDGWGLEKSLVDCRGLHILLMDAGGRLFETLHDGEGSKEWLADGKWQEELLLDDGKLVQACFFRKRHFANLIEQQKQI